LIEIAKRSANTPQIHNAAVAQAEALVDGFDAPWAQADAYTMIANARAQSDPCDARRILQKALSAIADLDVNDGRSMLNPATPYPDIIAAFARAGDTDEALALWRRIPPDDHVDRAAAATQLADAWDATGTSMNIVEFLAEVVGTIPPRQAHTRARVLAALARRSQLDDVLNSHTITDQERQLVAAELVARPERETVDAAWESLRDRDDAPQDNLVPIVGAYLQQRRPDEALAVLDHITEPGVRAKPLAWCAAYLAQTADRETAQTLVIEAAASMAERPKPDPDAWPPLGLAILTLDGRTGVTDFIAERLADADTLASVINRLPAVTHLVDDHPTLATTLADSYTWARSFQDAGFSKPESNTRS
jgi:hypothetical protein